LPNPLESGVTFSKIKTISMPGTFYQIYIQIVFAVKGRENLINNKKFEVKYEEKYLFEWYD
jgi:hypothetical protein